MAFWESQGGAAAIGAGAALLGNSGPEMPRKFLRTNKKLLSYGNELDMENQKEMFDYRINQGLEAGLTPWEMYTSGAGGAGGGTSGSGATLGNNYSQAAVQAEAQANQREMQQAQIMGNLAAVKMQTDAQKDVANINQRGTLGAAQISADTQRSIAALQNQIQKGQLEVSRDQLEMEQQRLANEMKIFPHQLEKAVNEVVTSSPEYQRAMKKLTMSLENLLGESLMKQYGIDPTLPQEDWNKLSEEDRKAAILRLTQLNSTVSKELGLSFDFGSSWVAEKIQELRDAWNTNNEPTEQSLGTPPPKNPVGEGNKIILKM